MRPTSFILLLMALLLTACEPQTTTQTSPRPVIVERVQPQAAARAASYSGEIHARYESELSFRVAGKVVERRVGLGDPVEAGQVLARLDASDQKMAAAAAKAQVEAAREKYVLAQSQYERTAALFENKATSQLLYDQRKTELGVASAQLKRAKKQYAVQQNQLDYTRLQATHAGVITQVRVEPGEVVAAGQPVLGLARDGERELWVAVPENRIDTVTMGEQVSIRFWALPDVQVPGRVREVAAEAEPGSRTYRIRITLLEQPAALRLGMSATAHFRDETDTQVIRLPLTSLYHANNKPAVWVVDEQTHKVALRPVTILRYAENAVVLAAGQALQPGDRVVTKGVTKLHAGQQVKPVDPFFDQGAAATENP